MADTIAHDASTALALDDLGVDHRLTRLAPGKCRSRPGGAPVGECSDPHLPRRQWPNEPADKALGGFSDLDS